MFKIFYFPLFIPLFLSVCLMAYYIMQIKSRLIRFDAFIDKDLSALFFL